MRQLTRYWVTFEYQPPSSEGLVVGRWEEQVGFGVTATDLDDAMSILRREWFERHGFAIPPVREVVADIDVSTLDDQLRPHMDPPNWRGMWFPRAKPLR